MGQKRPTAAALCLFLTIRPKGKNYEHEKICPSTETIDVKTLSLSPCNKTLLPVLNFPWNNPSSTSLLCRWTEDALKTIKSGTPTWFSRSRSGPPSRRMRKMGASPAFLPSSSLTAVDCSVQCSSHAPPSPVCLCLILNLRDRWSYFWSTYSDTRLRCPPWLWVDTERELSLPITTAIIIPLRSLENRKWKPYLHLYSAMMRKKIKVGSKPSPLKLALEGILVEPDVLLFRDWQIQMFVLCCQLYQRPLRMVFWCVAAAGFICLTCQDIPPLIYVYRETGARMTGWCMDYAAESPPHSHGDNTFPDSRSPALVIMSPDCRSIPDQVFI